MANPMDIYPVGLGRREPPAGANGMAKQKKKEEGEGKATSRVKKKRIGRRNG
jgi:hypothetical protein